MATDTTLEQIKRLEAQARDNREAGNESLAKLCDDAIRSIRLESRQAEREKAPMIRTQPKRTTWNYVEGYDV